MTGPSSSPPTIAQLHNLADRAGTGLTPDEVARLREGITMLDTLQQVARGYCPHCGRGDAAPTIEDWEAQRRRAGQAEAEVKRLGLMVDEYGAGAGALTDKLKRVRAARDRIAHAPAHLDAIWCLDQLDAALDGPGPAATQATEPAISPHPAEALLARLVNAPDAAEHCHTVPPNWDGGGPCEYCTALEEARALVKEQP
jgi:hypothetical protein